MSGPTTTVSLATVGPPRPRPLSTWAILLKKHPAGVVAGAVFLFIAIACFGAAIWAPYDPLQTELLDTLATPSAAHWLGTDHLGRDVFSRLLYGGQPSLIAAFQVTLTTLVISVPFGMLTGFVGGRFDAFVMRIVDLLMALPGMILVLLVLAVFDGMLQLAFFVLGLLLVPPVVRIIRASTIAIRHELFIDAARVAGRTSLQIVARHVFPRVLGPIIVQASIISAIALLFTSGLAYLGFGVTAPDPSWGTMIAEAAATLRKSPWVLISAGGILGITVLCLGVLGDVVRDAAVERWSGRPIRRQAKRRRPSATRTSSVPASVVEDSGALLSVSNLEVSYGVAGSEVRVTTDVSFQVDAGEIVGVVGESGCGKTTVARSILGLLRGGRVTSGHIRFQGSDLADLDPEHMRALRGTQLAYVSQDPMLALDPTRRVGDTVADAVRLHTGLARAQARARSIELLGSMGLPDPGSVARLYPHEVSGGMAQRIAIARALAGNPRLLIADEPTTALDVTVQAGILDLLRELRDKTGMAVIIVTHDWGVVSDLCDRAIVMYAGQIVEQAPVQDMFSAPRHPYTSALLASNPSLTDVDSGRLATIPGSIPAPEAWPAHCRFADRCALVTDECREGPIELVRLSADRETRCIRSLDVPTPDAARSVA